MIEADPLATLTVVTDTANHVLQVGPPGGLPDPVPDFVGDILGAIGSAVGDVVNGLGERVSDLTPGGEGESAPGR